MFHVAWFVRFIKCMQLCLSIFWLYENLMEYKLPIIGSTQPTENRTYNSVQFDTLNADPIHFESKKKINKNTIIYLWLKFLINRKAVWILGGCNASSYNLRVIRQVLLIMWHIECQATKTYTLPTQHSEMLYHPKHVFVNRKLYKTDCYRLIPCENLVCNYKDKHLYLAEHTVDWNFPIFDIYFSKESAGRISYSIQKFTTEMSGLFTIQL